MITIKYWNLPNIKYYLSTPIIIIKIILVRHYPSIRLFTNYFIILNHFFLTNSLPNQVLLNHDESAIFIHLHSILAIILKFH